MFERNCFPNLRALQRLTNWQIKIKYHTTNAEVAELADALRSGRSEHSAREGSNPSFGTKTPHTAGFIFGG